MSVTENQPSVTENQPSSVEPPPKETLALAGFEDASGDASGQVRPKTTWCGELELSEPALLEFPRTADGRLFSAARILIRVHGDPVGYIEQPLTNGRVVAADVLRAAEKFLPAVYAHLAAEALPEPKTLATPVAAATERCSLAPACADGPFGAPLVTVIVCTRNRPETLRGCLRSLRRLTHPSLEIIIVDNAPSDDSTKAAFLDEVGEWPAFRYVREDRPGLSRARNRGLAETHGEIVAFTDDDVTVDPAWVSGILRGFRQGEDIGCVTGLMATASLEEVAERYFDSRLTWSASCQPRRFDMGEHREPGALYPYSAGIFGSGANIAFRTAALLAVGPFDEALGAGTLTAGGEDLDIFVRVVLAGYGLYYEPASLVSHSHRSDVDALGRQMFAYGAGMTAYLAKHLANRHTGPAILSRIPRGLWAMRSIGERTDEATAGHDDLQRRLVNWEYAGYAAGPALYARSRLRVRAENRQAAADSVQAAGPIICGEFDLADPSSLLLPGGPDATALQAYQRARLLVRVHGYPLGYVDVPVVAGRLDGAAARTLALDTLAEELTEHLAADGLSLTELTSSDASPACLAPPASLPTVTVIVCTRDRPEMLLRCLEGLSALTYQQLEIVVVDNAPPDDSTEQAFLSAVAADPRFQYVREPRPGLSRARNRGLAEATGDIVAYTDDDVRVDPGWIEGVLRGFGQRADVRCVTGLVATASLDSPLERYFDARVSWSTSCVRRIFDLSPENSPGPLHPFSAGIFGTGANFAAHRSTLLELGGFDEALGAGTRTRGGEDLDIFVRILLDGHALAYEPSSLVWHTHRSDPAALAHQMFGYGSGLTAYIAKYCIDPATRARVLAGIPAGARHIARLGDRTRDRSGPTDTLPGGMRLREFVGMAAGPALYWRTTRRNRRNSEKSAI